VGKNEEKVLPGTLRRRWEDNIKMDLTEVRGVACIGSIWLRIGASYELL
jgi:hypothetical protein